MSKRGKWEGNGDGHVYEHVMTPPERRTWGPMDCPSFVRVCHPENAKTTQQHARPKRKSAPMVHEKRRD